MRYDQAPMYSYSTKYQRLLLMVSIFQGELLWLVVHDTLILHRGLRICSCSCQDCVGTIDGTHVTARVPISESHAYMGKTLHQPKFACLC
jgi:hypothetical protein